MDQFGQFAIKAGQQNHRALDTARKATNAGAWTSTGSSAEIRTCLRQSVQPRRSAALICSTSPLAVQWRCCETPCETAKFTKAFTSRNPERREEWWKLRAAITNEVKGAQRCTGKDACEHISTLPDTHQSPVARAKLETVESSQQPGASPATDHRLRSQERRRRRRN